MVYNELPDYLFFQDEEESGEEAPEEKETETETEEEEGWGEEE